MIIRKDKEKIMIYLYKQGKLARQIAKEAKSSSRDIGATIKKHLEKEEEQKQRAERRLSVVLYIINRYVKLFIMVWFLYRLYLSNSIILSSSFSL